MRKYLRMAWGDETHRPIPGVKLTAIALAAHVVAQIAKRVVR